MVYTCSHQTTAILTCWHTASQLHTCTHPLNVSVGTQVSYTHTHARAHTHTSTDRVGTQVSYTHTYTRARAHTHTHTLSHSLSLSHTHTHTHTLAVSADRSATHTWTGRPGASVQLAAAADRSTATDGWLVCRHYVTTGNDIGLYVTEETGRVTANKAPYLTLAPLGRCLQVQSTTRSN